MLFLARHRPLLAALSVAAAAAAPSCFYNGSKSAAGAPAAVPVASSPKPTTSPNSLAPGQNPNASASEANATVPSPVPVSVPSATAPSAGSFVFGPYKDVTVDANANTGALSTAVSGTSTPVVSANAELKLVSWAFATGECGSETWGGIAPAQLVDANVGAWVAANKRYILSTGGASGTFSCASDAGFAAFLDRYASASLLGVDFDVEAGQSRDVIDQLVARVKAAQQLEKYKGLRFSFTIATLGGSAAQSLGPAGVQVMQSIAAAGLNGVYINLMVMDYGSPVPGSCVVGDDGRCDMGASAVQAAVHLNATYKVPFGQIELTPMLGGNDVVGETFTLANVATLVSYARKAGLGGVHYWSLDRDVDCVQEAASPTCNSYGAAGPFGFLQAFTAALNAGH